MVWAGIVDGDQRDGLHRGAVTPQLTQGSRGSTDRDCRRPSSANVGLVWWQKMLHLSAFHQISSLNVLDLRVQQGSR
jgi:hypothetical protein